MKMTIGSYNYKTESMTTIPTIQDTAGSHRGTKLFFGEPQVSYIGGKRKGAGWAQGPV
jgi:hypothetical protein